MIKILYIDDENNELQQYENKFNTDDKSRDRFDIIALNSPKSTKDYRILYKVRPDLLLVDVELAKADSEGRVTDISGLSLSMELRQKFPEVPIVLFTRPSIFKAQNYSERTLADIDAIIYKKDLFSPGALLVDHLYDLAVGFSKLRRKKSKSWSDLLTLINAPQADYEYLKLAHPPINHKNEWTVTEAAAWIRNILIKYPGLLLDPIHSATFLGISQEAFLSEQIQVTFEKAKYKELFAPSEGRWRKSKLQQIAMTMMNKSEKNMSLREGFPLAWQRTKNAAIERSKCVFSGEYSAEWVCYILKKPVMLKYSLLYKPDSRPTVMDEARISYEAIRTTNEVNKAFLDTLGLEMLPQIRKMKKPGESGNGH